jgi:peroxiredoxin
LGLGIGIVLYFGLLRNDLAAITRYTTQESGPIPVPSLNAPAPNFELINLAGDLVQLEDYRGKPIILNFWATWCAPCRLEMPIFQQTYEDHTDYLAVVAINNAEPREDVQRFVDELDLAFEFLLDPDAKIQHLYQIHGYPTTIIIDAAGVIRIRHIGILTEEQLDGYLESIGLP